MSVSLCSKNSNLQRKTLTDRDISFDLPHPARATPRYPVRIYTQTHRSAFLKGDKLSQVYKNPLDTALFPGITAEQEQVSLTFNVLT